MNKATFQLPMKSQIHSCITKLTNTLRSFSSIKKKLPAVLDFAGPPKRQPPLVGKLQDHLAYPPRAMRAERAAAYLDMSTRTFLRLVDEGLLPPTQH